VREDAARSGFMNIGPRPLAQGWLPLKTLLHPAAAHFPQAPGNGAAGQPGGGSGGRGGEPFSSGELDRQLRLSSGDDRGPAAPPGGGAGSAGL
jgi:hypothetical protein